MRVAAGTLCAFLIACQTTTRVQPPADGPGAPMGPEQAPSAPPAPAPTDPPPPPPPPDMPPDALDAHVPATGAFVLRDAETGSLWNLRGEAFAGPAAEEGLRLRQLPAFSSFWFAWSVFNHDSDVWFEAGAQSQAVEAIEGAGACEVPCNEIVGGGPPKDGIPSLDHDALIGTLTLVAADDPGANYLADEDFVLGVVLYDADGEPVPRAYSHNVLWWHEIANDSFEDRLFTVSFCPLTGSGIVFPGGAEGLSFGTSGRLYNSNLVMYDRLTDSQWSQMLGTAITGPRRGDRLEPWPVTETTWGRWKALWPDTVVTSTETGHRRDYASYPYGSYRQDHSNTFRPTNPPYDDAVLAKVRTLGLRVGGAARGYPYEQLAALGDRATLNDTLGGVPVLIAYEGGPRLAVPFDRRIGERTFTFEVAEAL